MWFGKITSSLCGWFSWWASSLLPQVFGELEGVCAWMGLSPGKESGHMASPAHFPAGREKAAQAAFILETALSLRADSTTLGKSRAPLNLSFCLRPVLHE